MRIDARGPRFSAALTTVLLAAVLITSGSSLIAAALLAVQCLFFAIGSIAGVQRTPYGWLFQKVVRPRLKPPAETEDVRPPKFAQSVGMVFALAGLAGYLLGPVWLGIAATACALAAAFLNAAFGFCLGCEVYLVLRRAGHIS